MSFPFQMAPPDAAFLPSSYAHAKRVEGAIINLNVQLAMNGSNYTFSRGLILKVIYQYDVPTWISPDITDHSNDAAWNIVNKKVKRLFLGMMVTKLMAFILDWKESAPPLKAPSLSKTSLRRPRWHLGHSRKTTVDFVSSGGKSPSPNEAHNKQHHYTNNGGYQGVAAITPPWTGQVYTYPTALPPPPCPTSGILGAWSPHAFVAFDGHLQ
ncbi:hypothetical protein ZWY2020_024829 [Hordeum vulgare]|nr:hypothetical protein ZWY2020_024829 [Hordeum vulgare]